MQYSAVIFLLVQKRSEETDGRTKKAGSEVLWRRNVPNWSKMDLEIERYEGNSISKLQIQVATYVF